MQMPGFADSLSESEIAAIVAWLGFMADRKVTE